MLLIKKLLFTFSPTKNEQTKAKDKEIYFRNVSHASKYLKII